MIRGKRLPFVCFLQGGEGINKAGPAFAGLKAGFYYIGIWYIAMRGLMGGNRVYSEIDSLIRVQNTGKNAVRIKFRESTPLNRASKAY